MKTLAVLIFQIALFRLFVMPRPISGTGFQRRKNVHQARMRATRFQNVLDPFFLIQAAFADVLDFNVIGLGNRFGMLTNLIAQGLYKLGEIKDADVFAFQIGRHPFGIAQLMQRAPEHHAIKTVQDTMDLITIFFSQANGVGAHRLVSF
jgi:hypothetical protein